MSTSASTSATTPTYDLSTPEGWFAAVKADFRKLKEVPLELQTEEMYLEAVSQNVMMITSIPVERQTTKLRLAVIHQRPHMIEYLIDTTYDEQLFAVTLDGHALCKIRNPNPSLCIAAVRQTPDAIAWVPADKRTLEMAKLVLPHDMTKIPLFKEFLMSRVYNTHKRCCDTCIPQSAKVRIHPFENNTG